MPVWTETQPHCHPWYKKRCQSAGTCSWCRCQSVPAVASAVAGHLSQPKLVPLVARFLLQPAGCLLSLQAGWGQGLSPCRGFRPLPPLSSVQRFEGINDSLTGAAAASPRLASGRSRGGRLLRCLSAPLPPPTLQSICGSPMASDAASGPRAPHRRGRRLPPLVLLLLLLAAAAPAAAQQLTPFQGRNA